MNEKRERVEINDTLSMVLSTLNCTEEELMERFFCIREFKGTPQRRNTYMSLYLSTKHKKEYPKGEIINHTPGFYFPGREYAYKEDNRQYMSEVYQQYVKNSNVHNVCYDVVEMLHDGLLTGLCMKNEFGARKMTKHVRDYIFTHGFWKPGNQKHFTDLDDYPKNLSVLRDLEALKKHVVDEIVRYTERECYFVFVATEVAESEIINHKVESIISDIKYDMRELSDAGKMEFIHHLKLYLHGLDEKTA